MYNLEKEIKRKMQIRNEVKENICKERKETSVKEEFDESQLLSQKMKDMDSLYIVTAHSPIHSHRKIIGPVIVCMKKIVRKLMKIFMGWYFTPIFERQTDFNERALSSIGLLKNLWEKSTALELNRYREVNDRINTLENSLRTIENVELEKIRRQKEKVEQEIEALKTNVKYMFKKSNVYCDINLLSSKIDYLDFENEFRGSREEITRRQEKYIDYFRGNNGGPVIDIGCGRGEFLEIMKKEGINAYGIDMYDPFVNYCRDRGFKAELEDALTHMSRFEDNYFGGIFMDSVIEHLEDDYIIPLIKMAYKKIKPGSYFIIVGPNPESLGTWQNFNIDLQHKKPIHYLTLDYLLKRSGFSEVKRYENPYTDFYEKVFKIEGIDFANKEQFNSGMGNINKLVFGNKEYAIIAKK